MPTSARTGVNDDGFKRLTHTFSLLMPDNDKIQLVTVVPTFAPIITLIAWRRFISPELTKPTTITVVADELCITAVTAQPVRNPANLLVVIFARMPRSLLPALRSRASPIVFIPNRNRQSPPMSFNASNTVIIFPHTLKLLFYGLRISNLHQIYYQGYVKSM